MQRPPLPPFSLHTALAKVQAAENAWNTRDPATVALAAANELGAVGAHLVAYTTSGEASGDHSAVVGYAGICIHR